MKKKEKYKSKKIRRSLPLLWKRCTECGNKFKLEFMWRAKLITYTRYLCTVSHKTTCYICKNCAPTIQDADVLLPKYEKAWDNKHILLPPPNPRPEYRERTCPSCNVNMNDECCDSCGWNPAMDYMGY